MAVQKLSKAATNLGGAESGVIDHAARLRTLAFLLSQSVHGPHDWDLGINTALAVMIEESTEVLERCFYAAKQAADQRVTVAAEKKAEAANG